MTNNLDHMLRDLEKQVQDFTLTMKDTTTYLDEKEGDDDKPIFSTLSDRNPKKEELAEEEELRLAMQRAWAVLDAEDEQHEIPVIPDSPPKPLTTRIYIDDVKNYKVIQLTSVLTCSTVINYLKKKGLIDMSDDWTLFEIANSHGVERPLREWEIVLEIVNAWESDTGNALLVKKYSYHYTLTSDSILQKKIPPMHGWLSIEYKKGKWQKRFCFVKDNAIHHAKDKSSPPSILCHLATYDVYTLLQPLKLSPTPFVFAIRAQDRPSIYGKEGDYMRFLAVEKQEEMKDWVLSIRYTKSYIQYQYHPNQVMPIQLLDEGKNAHEEMKIPVRNDRMDYEKSRMEHEKIRLEHEKARLEHERMKLEQSKLDHERNRLDHEKSRLEHDKPLLDREEDSSPIIRRHKSTKESYKSDHKSGDERRIGRSQTVSKMRHAAGSAKRTETEPLIDYTEAPTFAKGSLLAKEEDEAAKQQQLQQQQLQLQKQQQQQTDDTLIHIDNRFAFSKGSLLHKQEHTKVTRSKSTRETSHESENHRRHTSLRRKPTAKRHDVPLPPSPSTLLKLDDTPESFHSRELHGRHVKPLLNFDSK
ncbi:hypothetical protein BDB01DRAFT_861059 [Pilobolus umbonatus]|nr:hypothetical protein BDB01DRAFT_861059 [Pilobolus umbonatus]